MEDRARSSKAYLFLERDKMECRSDNIRVNKNNNH